MPLEEHLAHRMQNSAGVLLAFLFAGAKYSRRSNLRMGGFILVQFESTFHHHEESLLAEV